VNCNQESIRLDCTRIYIYNHGTINTASLFFHIECSISVGL